MQLWTKLLSTEEMTSLHYSLSQVKFYLKRLFILSITFTIYGGTTPSFLRSYLKVIDHVSITGYHPKWTGYRYTIPHRETVAGEATAKSLTSNNIVKVAGNFIRWPLDKHNILLSSSTVFKFSIHNASTGPSNSIHFFVSVPSATLVLTIAATIPSVHSLVRTLVYPKS